MSRPPFANTCSIRDCPQKIVALKGLSMEAIFEIEIAFTESAALLGYKDFARENLKSVMGYYTGKIQLSPYYLYLAGVVTAIDQHEYASRLLEQFKSTSGNTVEGKLQIKLYYQKLAMFYFSKNDEVEGRKYITQYYQMGERTMQEGKDFVSLLNDKRYERGRENKVITQYLETEMDSLLLNKEFIATHNNYCLMLGAASDLYRSSKKYREAKNIMDLTKKVCPEHFYKREYNILRCMTGEADIVLAEIKAQFYGKDENGNPYPMSHGLTQSANLHMEMLNMVGLYKESLEIFEYMKKKGIKKFNEYMYNALKNEACISYYHLKDYANARKMMGDITKTNFRYIRYWAKLYALDGNSTKAKELYNRISVYPGAHFDEEDIRIQDQ